MMQQIKQDIARHAEGYLRSLWEADPLLGYLLRTITYSCAGRHLSVYVRFRRRVLGDGNRLCRREAVLPWRVIQPRALTHKPHDYHAMARSIESAVQEITREVRRGVLGKHYGFAALFSKGLYAGLDLKQFELKPGRISISEPDALKKCAEHLKVPGYLLVGKGLFDWMDSNSAWGKEWRRGTSKCEDIQLLPYEHLKAAKAYAFSEGALRLHLLTDSLLDVQEDSDVLSRKLTSRKFTITFYGMAFYQPSQVARIK